MKKNYVIVVLLLHFVNVSFSQELSMKLTPEYLVYNEYETIIDCNALTFDQYSKQFKETNYFVKKGTIVAKDDYEYIYGIDPLFLPPEYLVDTLNFKIRNSDCFNTSVIYSFVKKDQNLRWVPIWYFDALNMKNRDLISDNEQKRNVWDGDWNPNSWFLEIPQVSSLIITNVGMCFYTPLEVYHKTFLFSSLKEIESNTYVVTAYPDIEMTDNDIFWTLDKENFPHLEEGNSVKFCFEITGNVMKIYNGETNKLCMELIQMPAEWVKLYETFIKYNTVPEGLYIPDEYYSLKK